MKKWLVLLGVCLLAIAAYVGSGPYRAIHAIREAVQAEDAAALSRQVDFPALRASLKAQLSDRLVRKAGPGVNRASSQRWACASRTGSSNRRSMPW